MTFRSSLHVDLTKETPPKSGERLAWRSDDDDSSRICGAQRERNSPTRKLDGDKSAGSDSYSARACTRRRGTTAAAAVRFHSNSSVTSFENHVLPLSRLIERLDRLHLAKETGDSCVRGTKILRFSVMHRGAPCRIRKKSADGSDLFRAINHHRALRVLHLAIRIHHGCPNARCVGEVPSAGETDRSRPEEELQTRYKAPEVGNSTVG